MTPRRQHFNVLFVSILSIIGFLIYLLLACLKTAYEIKKKRLRQLHVYFKIFRLSVFCS